MFDHVVFGVTGHEASKIFFLKALDPIGIQVLAENQHGIELGADGKTSLCLFPTSETPAHLQLAFVGTSREQVDVFHRAALAAGGKDNGAPGMRPNYSGRCYAAFVLDPDGHKIEVVYQEPED